MSMKAVVFRGPFDIGIEERTKPRIQDASDAIVRVKLAGICGRYEARIISQIKVLTSKQRASHVQRTPKNRSWTHYGMCFDVLNVSTLQTSKQSINEYEGP